MSAFRRLYGAGPLHLLGALATLAVVALAAGGWFEEPAISLKYILIWLGGAVLAHDLLLLPAYSVLDRLALLASRRGRAEEASPPSRSPGWVYVRVPGILSGLVLLVFAPEILRTGEATFHVASGQSQHVYLGRYLVLVGVLFALSALAYLAARVRSRSA